LEVELALGVGTGPANWSGPVSVWAATKSAQIQNLILNLKNEKFLKNF
jgi:hypothetical protein